MRDELVAYAILESFSEPAPIKKLETLKHDLGLWTVKFYTHLQDFDVRNRNRRIYSSDVMIPALSSPILRELMGKGAWIGEYDHPMLTNCSNQKEAIARIGTYSQQHKSHKILSMDINKSGVDGWIETTPMGFGQEFAAAIVCGQEPAFSLRALAKIGKSQSGDQLINTPPRVITYDAVVLPSHQIAYRDTSKPIMLNDGRDDRIVRESFDINDRCSLPIIDKKDKSFKLTLESLNSFIAMESTNIKMISDQYEVATENINVTNDMKSAIIKDKDMTYVVSLEEKVSKMVTESLINLLD